jgi:predicted transcriptional regulator
VGDWIDETLRARSSAVFGNRYVAEVVITIVALAPEPKSRVTVRMIAQQAELTDSLVRPVVKRLVDAGLLVPQEQQRPRGPNYHEVRLDLPLWKALEQTCKLLSRSG